MEDFLRMIPPGRHWRFVATTITILTWVLYLVADVQQIDLDLEDKIELISRNLIFM